MKLQKETTVRLRTLVRAWIDISSRTQPRTGLGLESTARVGEVLRLPDSRKSQSDLFDYQLPGPSDKIRLLERLPELQPAGPGCPPFRCPKNLQGRLHRVEILHLLLGACTGWESFIHPRVQTCTGSPSALSTQTCTGFPSALSTQTYMGSPSILSTQT